MPSQRSARNTSRASWRTVAALVVVEWRRHQQAGAAVDVLVLVVVELVAGHDLARQRSPGTLVAQHRHLDLPALDGLLQHHPLVVGQRDVDGPLDLGDRLRLRHARPRIPCWTASRTPADRAGQRRRRPTGATPRAREGPANGPGRCRGERGPAWPSPCPWPAPSRARRCRRRARRPAPATPAPSRPHRGVRGAGGVRPSGRAPGPRPARGSAPSEALRRPGRRLGAPVRRSRRRAHSSLPRPAATRRRG